MYRSSGKYRRKGSRMGLERKREGRGRGRSSSRRGGRSTTVLTISGLRRSLWVLENMEVEDGVYRVASSGSSGEVYEFTAEKCSCEGFKRRGVCKHVVAALLFQAVSTVVSRLEGQKEGGNGKGE